MLKPSKCAPKEQIIAGAVCWKTILDKKSKKKKKKTGHKHKKEFSCNKIGNTEIRFDRKSGTHGHRILGIHQISYKSPAARQIG